MKEGSDKLSFFKGLKFCVSRDIIKKMKKQATGPGKNIFWITYLVKDFYPEWNKELLKLNSKTNNPI